METTNTISSPQGPEFEFLVGEGRYVLREELLLSTPPPHLADTPAAANPNPLATTARAETAGTRLSLISTGARSSQPPSLLLLSPPPPLQPPAALSLRAGTSSTTLSLSGAAAGSGPRGSLQELQTPLQQPSEGRPSHDAGASSDGGGAGGGGVNGAAGEGTSLLAAPGAASGAASSAKRRKPKNGIVKTGSSFISRVIVNEHLSRRLQIRPSDGVYAFANVNRSVQWLDLSSPSKHEYLAKILFRTGHCLCHDVNQATRTVSHVDVIMGFSTGDLIWWEPIAGKYSRLNKNGLINPSPVADVKWRPGSDNLIVAAHGDGTLVVYDKEREDAPFSPEDEFPPNGVTAASERPNLSQKIHVVKSARSRDQKSNPVAVLRVTTRRINAFAFSPDDRHLAVVAADGTLRIIDYLKEELLHLFRSYYGGFSCVCWSPDGKYILTGGQDDLVTIWSLDDNNAALVARCEGHRSWVTSVAFDPWRCDDRNYRFGSVGEDTRLCLWDFGVGTLHRPKVQRRVPASSTAAAAAAAAVFAAAEVASAADAVADTDDTTSSSSGTGSDSSDEDAGSAIDHPVVSQSRVLMLPPVLNKQVDSDPLSWLEFTEESIIISSSSGHVRTWDRPSHLTGLEGEGRWVTHAGR